MVYARQRTYYHFRNDNAPVLQMETDDQYFSFVVKTDFADSHHRFDQCGVVVYLNSENWIKGNYYKLLHIASDSETLESIVVYQALYGENKIWVRPEMMFFEEIERDGKRFRCFEEVSESEVKSLGLV